MNTFMPSTQVKKKGKEARGGDVAQVALDCEAIRLRKNKVKRSFHMGKYPARLSSGLV